MKDYILKVLDKGMALPPIMTDDFKNTSEYGAYCMLLGYKEAKKKYKKKKKLSIPKCKSAER